MKEEIWKDIPNYEGYYQVSDMGNVRSLDRTVPDGKVGTKRLKCRLIVGCLDKLGYRRHVLSKKNAKKTHLTSQLVAQAFLNHPTIGSKLVVDHINGVTDDNRLSNLRIVTHRENLSTCFRANSESFTSKYVGVSKAKVNSKWCAHITHKSKRYHLGYFENEIDASTAYQTALKEIKNGVFNNYKK